MTPSAAPPALPSTDATPAPGVPASGRRSVVELPLALPAGGGAAALAAFALLLARLRGDDAAELRVRAAGGERTLRLDASANPSARDFAAGAARALAGAPGEGDAASSGFLAEEAGPGSGVALRVGEGDAGLRLDAERVRPDAALHIAARLQVILGAMADGPDGGVLHLPVLTPGERAARVRWNATEADLPHGVLLHRAFEARADADPRAVAVVHAGEEITYGALEADANRLARHLRRLGVGPESRVGICVERGPRVPIAILGVLKAGGAYVPLDPAYPPERLARMLGTAAVRVLVTEASLAPRLPAAERTVLLDGDAAAIAAEPPGRVDGGAAPENLAYVIFTSGSTGEPKGIALAHRGVMNNVADLNRGHGVGPADRVLLLSSLSFDMSVYETLGILAAGGATVIPRAEELRDPAAWAALCRRHGVTVWNSAPALLGMLCDHAEAHPEQAPSGLRLAFLGGDWVPVPLVDRVRAWAPGLRDFIVMGGATEASIHSVIYPVRAVDPAWRSIPYGVPMANQRAYVLDRHLRHLPAGVAGELFLAGIGLARGYTGRAGFSAERFLPDPHGAPGARMYRTGDLARYGEDGTIELLGRIDHQLKIRGLRIEPGEIETALRRHPAVARAVVVSRTDGGESRLVAYLVPAEGAAVPPARELRDALRETLPDYMVPAAYVALDRLPLSPNGKVDRRQLPAPPEEPERAPFVAPRTPAEAALAEIWGEVLGVERVGADDDFFALGGHSLTATRVASRVRERMGVRLGLGEFFRVPTLRDLAAAVEAGGADAEAAPIPRLPGDGPFPLSFAQERLWFLDRLQPESAFYNIPCAVRLTGALDAAALERALGEVVRRHETLRTVFEDRGGAPVQRITPFTGFALPVHDLADAAAAAREDEVERRAAEEARRPFDLAAGPLFRAALLRVGAEEHVLLLCMHHVAGDGWSLEVLFRELPVLYDAFRSGRPSPLAAPAVRYADYAAWQREALRGPAFDARLAWWRARLAGAPGLLELPTDRPRPAVQRYRGARERFALSAGLVDRLAAAGRAQGATLYMVLLAAFQVLLGRCTGSTDVVVGSPVAGRTRAELEGMIGFFANMLALRTDLSGDPDFGEVLRRVREGTLGAYEHQDVPFDRLVEELSPERGLDRSPLVQVVFALQGVDRSAVSLPGVASRGVEVETGTTKFDLFLELTPAGGGLRGELEYATDLFDAATLRRMAGHLARLLEQVADGAAGPVGALELMDAEERSQVLDGWNRAVPDYPADRTVHQLFAAQAARTPDAPALVHRGEALTYAELDARAGRLAGHLRARGVGPEVRVGVCLERTPELVVSLLAVHRAGGAYVPLDPAYPRERLGWMMEDADVRLVLTSTALADRLPAGADAVRLDAVREQVRALPPEVPESGAAPENLSHVIFTSGSTGRPKGVMIRHSSVAVLLQWMRDHVPDEERAAVLASTSINFDVSVAEIFGTLCWGGTLVLVENALDLPAVADQGIRYASMVPTAAAELLRAGGIPASVRTLNLGGEALPNDLAQAIHRLGTVQRVLNAYGPTEDTTYSAVAHVRKGADRVLVGPPLANTRAYVLDEGLRPVPIGVIGELYLAGGGLSRGYASRPALTAERFIPDPFGAPGSRMYRVMDRIRWTPGGELEYFGRTDFQVKVRGFRIELGEIETTLRAHPAVQDAVAVVREDAPGDRRIVAYVVAPRGGEAPSAAELRAHVRSRLPEYMVPSGFVALDALPRTPNGKTDRRALPAPKDAGLHGAEYVAPRTPVEEALAGLFAEILGVERVGAEDGFFELGGHSLLATRVVARIPEVLGVELPVAALFEASTVAELAARVEARTRAGGPRSAPIVPADRTRPLPLSFAQERLWFLQRMQPESPFYNLTAVVRLSGPLDVPALERALGEIVRRHESLRTVFPTVDDDPVQVIAPFAGFSLPVEDAADAGGAERGAWAERRAAEEAERPYDLAAGPLFRPVLLRLGDEEHVLLLSMHHIVTDEWGMETLFRELGAAYAAFREGRAPELPVLPVQYADYAVWQREQLTGELLERRVAWWRERLAGAPALLELPADHPRPAVQSFRGATVDAALPAGLRPRLEALGRGEGATLYMVALAAFQSLLARYTGADDVVVGSPVAGQTRREVQDLVGFFADTLVLRTDLSGDPSFRTVLRRVREAALGAWQHQEVPFERLVAELQPERSLSHSPLFQVAFVLADADPSRAELPGVRMRRGYAEAATSKYDLMLTIAPEGETLRATLEYSTDLFERATVRRMLGHVQRVLEEVCDNPDAPLSALALLGEDERRLVIHEWNRTDASFPADACVHELFEAQAERTPDAEAVVCEGESLSYAGLNARANRLAHHLIGHGVGADTPVGICLERGAEMIVSVLAVLKAGGACVPLDPGYPAGRLAYMAAGAGLPVLVTQASLCASLPPLQGVRIVLADEVDDEVEDAAERAVNPTPRALPGSLAYVLYTSGSTGTPKGVAQPHEALVNLVAWHQADALLSAPRRTLQFASLSFDVSFQEIAVTLAAGGTLVLVDDELRRDPHRLPGYLARHRVERLFLPFVALQALAEAAGEGAPAAALREIVTAGEQLICTPRLAAWIGGMPGCRLVNHYGPTETHVATAHTLAAGPEGWDVLPPIGGPVANTRAYVLDARLAPVPIGIPGELYVAGVQVARGYRGRPALTAERFVPDPFAADGGRMYRTGDRVRWKECALEYLGRADHQAKIRGFRVEPGEVEAALRRHPGVTDCAVVAREDAPGERRLVAYVAGGADAAALRAHLRDRLPEYMVPAAFVAVERLPLTPSGKLDRRALPAPEPAAAAEGYVAPRTAEEAALAALWAELLRVERVGIRDGFFALGGHSLLATRVVSRVRRELGVELPLRALFEAPTVEALAARVAAERAGAAGSAPPADPTRAAIAAGSPQSLLGALDDLSDEELDRLLAEHP